MYNQEIEQECPYDCFELIDWAIENHPEFYESIRCGILPIEKL